MSETLKTPAFGLIGNALKSTAADHIVAVADDLYDENSGKYQSEINRLVLQGNTNNPHYFMTTDQYTELITNNEVIIDGQLIIYDPNAYYALYESDEE